MSKKKKPYEEIQNSIWNRWLGIFNKTDLGEN